MTRILVRIIEPETLAKMRKHLDIQTTYCSRCGRPCVFTGEDKGFEQFDYHCPSCGPAVCMGGNATWRHVIFDAYEALRNDYLALEARLNAEVQA